MKHFLPIIALSLLAACGVNWAYIAAVIQPVLEQPNLPPVVEPPQPPGPTIPPDPPPDTPPPVILPPVAAGAPCRPSPECIIVDDRDAGFSKSGPGWESRVQAGFGSMGYGGDYLYISRGKSPNGLERAAWRAQLPKAGRYEVWATWLATLNRDDHVEFWVRAGGWKGPFVVSQRTDLAAGEQVWAKLGEFALPAGEARVRLIYSKAGASYSEEADAVAWKWIGP
jgi:hypothetical protein